jgi:hypothetical protein
MLGRFAFGWSRLAGLPGSGSDPHPGRFGFSWIVIVSLRKPPKRVGFPWILSSESRLFNGLRGIFLEKFFLLLLSVAWAISVGGIRFWHAEGRDCSWAKLNLISDFLQAIMVRAVHGVAELPEVGPPRLFTT